MLLPNYRRNLSESQQLLLLPSSEDDAWDGNTKSIAVAQHLQGSCHWETLEIFMVCAFSVCYCLFGRLQCLFEWASFVTFLLVRNLQSCVELYYTVDLEKSEVAYI